MTPRLRFAEFSDEWQMKRLGDVAIFEQGVQVDLKNQKEIPFEGSVRFLRIENYTQNSDDYRYIDKNIARGKSINKNEVAIVRYGASAGFVATGQAGVLANNLFSVTPNVPYLVSTYLTVYLKLNKTHQYFQSEMAGGAMPALSFGIVSRLKIAYPQKPEQEKIADFLTVVDARISVVEQKLDSLEKYKKAVMQQIFSQKIRFKKPDGTNYPNWQEKPGDAIFMNVSERNKQYNLPILAITQDQGAVPRDQINFDISVTDRSVENYKVVKKGDFIISLRSFQGGIEYSDFDGICSPAYIVLRHSIPVAEQFYKNYLKTKDYIQKLTRKLEGIRDGKMISYKYFSEVGLPYPTIEEQQKISDFLTALDDKITAEQARLDLAKQWKKGLLQRMFV